MLCMAMLAALTGCSRKDKTETESNKDYVTLSEYEEISLKSSDIDQSVDSTVNSMLEQYGSYKKLKKGKVKSGDTVNIYYVGRINGKKFDGGSLTKKDSADGYNLTIGSGSFISGFEDGLIGARPGQTLDVKATFPDPYENNPDLAGKKAVFTVTVNYIQGDKVLPELTDKFVKKNLTGYSTAEEYKASVREDAVKSAAWDEVYNSTEILSYPEDRVDAMYQQLRKSIIYYLEQQNYTLSDYLESQNTTSEDFTEQLQDTARTDVGKQLVYGAIAEEQKLAVTEDEYQEELSEYLTNYQCDDEDALNELFQQYYGTDARDLIEDDLLFQKVKDYLAGNVIES